MRHTNINYNTKHTIHKMNFADKIKSMTASSSEEKKFPSRSETWLTMPKKDTLRGGKSVEIRLRLLPDFKTSETSVGPYVRHYHGFVSKTTGKYLEINCTPDCPVCARSIMLYKAGNTASKEISRKPDTYYLNAYVVDNPLDPAQNGTVKVFKFGKKVKATYDVAVTGRMADDIGLKLFDLSPAGYTFVLRAVGNGEWPQYDESYVETASKSKKDVAGLTKERIEEIYGSAFALPELFHTFTKEEALKALEDNTDLGCVADPSVESGKDTDNIPF